MIAYKCNRLQRCSDILCLEMEHIEYEERLQ